MNDPKLCVELPEPEIATMLVAPSKPQTISVKVVTPNRAEIINLVAMHYRITKRQAIQVLAEFFDTSLNF